MKRIWGVLGLLLAACGQSAKNAPDDGGGDGGTSAAGAPSTEPQSCLYPTPGLTLGPGTKDQPRQSLQLSQPMPLTGLGAAWSDLAATYDVNGDAISDFVYLDQQAQPARFRLATTNSPLDAFGTTDQDCAALQALPAGRLLLRDLNGDQVPDFVVGHDAGISAFLNEPAGLRQVLGFQTTNARSSLINVGTADLNGDGRTDLVASLDSVLEPEGADFEVTAFAFAQAEDGSFSEPARHTSPHLADEPFHTGYLAVGRFGETASAVIVQSDTDAAGHFGVQTDFAPTAGEEIALPDGLDQRIYAVFTLPSASGADALLAVSQDTAYVLDLSGDAPRLVAQQALAFPQFATHEFGGGPERPRAFAYDVDRDGDLDFLQVDEERTSLAVYLNFGNQKLDEPQRFSLAVRTGAEQPFLQVGPGSGVVGLQNPDTTDPAVYTLIHTVTQ